LGEAEKAAVWAVIESGQIAEGPRVAEFERRFAALCGVRQAIATSSGTTALHVALLAHNIGPGDEVITVPFTFIASANSILFTGARPVFVDIDPETYCLDPAAIEAAITPRTKAILPVHLYGQMADMEAITTIARRHNLIVIEDAAQAHGASLNGRPAGTFGTGCFSFYATKNVTTGEGGMITTNDEAIADACRLMRAHGMRQRYYHESLGYNFRLTDLQAAIGLVQLDRLAELNQKRAANAAYLTAHLQGWVKTPVVRPGAVHAWHQYTIRVPGDRDAFVARLKAAGVGYGIYYPVPVHQQAHYRQRGYGDLSFPHSEEAARQVVSLPVHPALTEADLERIVAAVKESLP